MRKTKVVVLLVLAFLLKTGFLFSNVAENPWKEFVNRPDKKGYELCSRMINDSLHGPYETNEYGEKINTPTQLYLIDDWDLYGKFLMLVRTANPYAMELAFQLYPLADGAAGEDLFRSLGTTIKVEPHRFLSMMKKYGISNSNVIKTMILSYPLEEFVDNLKGRILETEERIMAFRKVGKREFFELREQCLDILSNYLTKLRKIEIEMSQKN